MLPSQIYVFIDNRSKNAAPQVNRSVQMINADIQQDMDVLIKV